MDIEVQYIPLSEIVQADTNPKDHDIGAIYQSIKRFGFTQPIMMNENTGKLLAGHGRLQTLQTLKDAGEKVPNRIKEKDGEWLVPVLKGISFEDDNEAQAYLIADNRLTELGGWNTGELVDELERLIQAGLDLDGIGYDFDDLETMVSDHFVRDMQPLKNYVSRHGIPLDKVDFSKGMNQDKELVDVECEGYCGN